MKLSEYPPKDGNWCKCGAPLDPQREPKAPGDMCIHCRRHDNRHTANCAALVDCMIAISRAVVQELKTHDSRPIEETRAAAIETLKKQLK